MVDEAASEAARLAVGEVYAEYAASMLAGSASRYGALWTDDGVQMAPDAMPVVGRQEIERGIGLVFESIEFVAFEILVDEIQVAGDWGYCRGTFTNTVVQRGAEELHHSAGKFLTILARGSDGSWKVHRDMFNSNPT